MCTLFQDVPEAIGNTGVLSDRLTFQINDMGYEFPRYPIPDGDDMDSLLRKRTIEGVARRYGCKASAKLRTKADKQVNTELALIAKLKLAGYFLIVWDVVEFCRRQGILVQGRGSAANSAVCYSLGITAVDPVGMELLFERFLTEVRGEWPDIDLDLPSGDDRERAIQYVYDRYGQLGDAMCANVITYRGRSAAREVGKALGFDADMQTRLTRLVGSFEWKGPTDTMEHHFRQAGFDLHHPRIAKYLELSIRMLDLPRHLGQHSGGMIIAQGQLASVVPIESASMVNRNVVQWDKEDCSDMGLIKVDLLGLGMMAVLKDCVELIPKYYGKQVDIAQIPHDDSKVYESLRRADTIGLFQVESRAQMASLLRNNPDKFCDLVVQVAIIRPGPIVGQVMNPYIERRQGRQEIEYPHPLLEPVLRRTLGVPATAIVAAIGNGAAFRKGRDFAAWLGIVPRQYSTGGKARLFSISKRGNVYLRKMLIHGARAAVLRVKRDSAPFGPWLDRLDGRAHTNVAVVAMANKLARIAWAVLSSGNDYRSAAVPA